MYRIPDSHRPLTPTRSPRLQRVAAYRRLGYRVVGVPSTTTR